MKLKLEEKIGAGGQAEVHRATDDSGQEFAVKVFFRYGLTIPFSPF